MTPAQKAWETRRQNALTLGTPLVAKKAKALIEVKDPLVPDIKFMKYYVELDGVRAKASYSRFKLASTGEDCITVYGKNYQYEFGQIAGKLLLAEVPGMEFEDNTDTMSDYFDNGRIRIKPSSPLWDAALARCN